MKEEKPIKEYNYGWYVVLRCFEDKSILRDNRRNRTYEFKGKDKGKAFPKAKELKEFYESIGKPIYVTCNHCNSQFDEVEVEIEGISESADLISSSGIGYDEVEFKCPSCLKYTKSLRRG